MMSWPPTCSDTSFERQASHIVRRRVTLYWKGVQHTFDTIYLCLDIC